MDVLIVNEIQSLDQRPRWWRARPESWWWIALVIAIPVILLTGLAAWVLIATTHPAEAADRIDLVKTALAVGAGTGGVITLILASRRQWHLEQAQLGTENDATERRITELYTKAADQLGSEKAPVRLAGLYALERLAQDNPTQRQTVVNVLCAYLRMPYSSPADTPAADNASEAERTGFEASSQERQVRLTAQRILAMHLRLSPDESGDMFWRGMDLDLSGAILINLDFRYCQIRVAAFDKTQFVGRAGFAGARFIESATFFSAQFRGHASFTEAAFVRNVDFSEAQFAIDSWFSGVLFQKKATFTGVRFAGDVMFEDANFADVATFDGARFAGRIGFNAVRFTGRAWFIESEFAGDAGFDEARFAKGAGFDDAQFMATAGFEEAQFAGPTSFRNVRFDNDAEFRDAQFVEQVTFSHAQFAGGAHLESWVRTDVDVSDKRVWPDGWKVRPTPDRRPNGAVGKWGRLTPINPDGGHVPPGGITPSPETLQ